MNFKHPIILASSSPRRQYLMQEAGFTFTVQKPDSDESFSTDMPVTEVAKYLALKKAEGFKSKIKDEVVICADTVVILGDLILNKPANEAEAKAMLELLSGKTHLVMTGVCLLSSTKMECFDDTTEVTFKNLSSSEIDFYVQHHKPFDKAGAYGAQDWIGLVAIQRIVGSYFNVMGLPVHALYDALQNW